MATANLAAGLTDSDILIDATHNRAGAIDCLLSQQTAGAITISIISAMELIQGCRNSNELAQVRQFLQPIIVTPITPKISQSAQNLMEKHFLSHGLMIPDALIAATALEMNLPLCSKNIRHYRMIADLNVIRPY